MDRHAVIGTAGHVDHGKTALVKALTGTDTDRLAEEKRRGITIDLGFAALRLGPDLAASIVDVPGHEDFVRNMVAGATGVDLALLVVAADEGIMPQTEEHLAILEYLGVGHGVVALTKADLVDSDWLELVRSDLAERLARSSVRWEAIEPVSVLDGRGLPALQDHLARAAGAAAGRDAADLFRLPVDRVFSIAGAGTVVTGTTWSGTVRPGDEVVLFPGHLRARVRGVEVHGQAAPAAEPGRRTALALVGVDRDAVARGAVVVTGDHWRETPAVDVIVNLLPGAKPLTQRTRLRLHHGTAEVIARVTPADSAIGPGESGVVRLRLESPLVTRWGDRGVLRTYSPVATMGGVVVLDPWPAARPRRPDARTGKGDQDAAARLTAFVAAQSDTPLEWSALPVRVGLRPGEGEQVLPRAPEVTRIGNELVLAAAIDALRAQAMEAMRRYHDAHPLEPGMRRDALRRLLGGGAVADQVEAALATEGIAVREGGTLRLAQHRAAVPEELQVAGPALLDLLARSGLEGCTVVQLQAGVPALGERAVELVEFYVRDERAVKVGKDRYYARGVVEEVVRVTLNLIRSEGSVGPAQLREKLGLTRKYLIPLLEWMDGTGVTVRSGDVRRAGPEAHHFEDRLP